MNNYSEIVRMSMTSLLETSMIFEISATVTEFEFATTSFVNEHFLFGASTKYEVLVTVMELNLQIFKYSSPAPTVCMCLKSTLFYKKMKFGNVLNASEFKSTKNSSGARESWLLFNKQADKKGRIIQALNCLIGTIK